MDADRLDYLIRDSEFTGVNYGRVELDYIISNIRHLKIVNDDLEESIIAIDSNGMHGIEHYLLARFFERIQIIKNPQVFLMDFLGERIFK